jgi:hypothetical protein
MVEGRQVDGLQLPGARGTGDRQLVADGEFLRGQVGDLGCDEALRDAEDLRGTGDQDVLREVAVAVVGGLGQGVGEAGLDPLGAVARDADRRGDRIGGLETDPPDVRGQPVGLLLNGADRFVAVFLVDLHRQGRGDADALQEDHDLLDGLLLGPRVLDAGAAFRAEAGDFDEAAGLVVDDVHDAGAEVADHPFGHDRADALDQAGSQVPADALLGGGQHGRVGLDIELPAVLEVGTPAAAQPERLADLRPKQRADRGDELGIRADRPAPRAPVRRDPRDRVPGLRIAERNPLKHPVKNRDVLLLRLLRLRCRLGNGRRHSPILPGAQPSASRQPAGQSPGIRVPGD